MKTVSKIGFFLFLTILLSFQNLYATDSTQVIHYTLKNGLPSNNIYSGLINRQGYLWFATDKGVLRYNGYSFKVYNAANAGLPDDDVYTIQEDGLGRLWISTLTRRYGYLENDRFHSLPSFENFSKTVVYPHNFVPVGKKLFFTVKADNLTVFCIDSSGKISGHYTCDNRINVYLIRNGRLLVIDGNQNTFYVDLNSAHPQLKRISKLPFEWFEEAKRGRMFIDKNGIFFCHDKDNPIVSRIDFFANTRTFIDITKVAGIEGEIVYTMPEINNIPTIITNKHICTFDDHLNLIGKEPLPVSIFNNRQVSFKVDDSSGDSWYTTNNYGILRLMKHRGILQNFKPGIPENAKYAGCLSGKYSMWTIDGGSTLYSLAADGSVKKFGLPASSLKSIFAWSGDTIGLAYSNKFYFFNLKNGAAQKFLKGEGTFVVSRLVTDSLGQHFYPDTLASDWLSKKSFWEVQNVVFRYADELLSCNALGIYLYHARNDSVFAKRYSDERYVNGYHSDFLNKTIFYNTERVDIFDLKKERHIEIPVTRVLNLDRIKTIKEDSFGNTYLLSENKLMLFYGAPIKMIFIPTQFSVDNVQLDVYKNNLIITGKFGVACAKILGKGKVGTFYITPNNDKLYENITKLWINEHNNVILQTDNGFVQTNIDSVYAYGINQDKERTAKFSFALNFPYQQAIHQGDTINIDQKDQRLSLDAINFYGKGNVQYNYKINSSQWSQSATGEILLTSLKPNQYYKLQLTAKDDIWQSKTITAWIYVTPYWWQTSKWHIIFIVAGAIILALSILGIISIIREAVIKANEKKRKLTDLELRAIHSQINPHFIFNTLSTALYFITRKDFDNAYNHVNKFSKLLRSYLKSSHDRFMLLSEEIEMLKRYIELQQTRFENRFDYEIHVENKVPAGDIQIPSLLLQPLVENAINHGLFHLKHRKGLLLINFEQGKNATELICTIEDNGVGRDAASTIKKESDADRQSYGSKLTEKLVEIFRQYEEMNIHIEYRDKPEPEKGTVVKLTISNVRYIGFES